MLPCINGYGLTISNENAGDFQFGEMIQTSIKNDSLILATNPDNLSNWTLSYYPSSPPGRRYHSMTYNSVDKIDILFGGTGPMVGNDTWVYNASNSTWTECHPKASPCDRMSSAMAYSTLTNCVLLFGGKQDETYLNDTWSFDYASGEWTEHFPSQHPYPRSSYSMVYNQKNGVFVLFGGLYTSPNKPYEIYFGDTWTYNYSSNEWTDMSPSTSPEARSDHAMAYDNSTGSIVLFGGKNGKNSLNDTWIYDTTNNSWIKCDPTMAPAPRNDHCMVEYHDKGSIFLYGGKAGTQIFEDLWTYDLSNNIWMELLALNGPSARTDMALTYEVASKELLLFGGYNSTYSNDDNFMDDYWKYNPTKNTWNYLGEQNAPLPRDGFGIAYNSKDNIGVLFGGRHIISQYELYYGDTWVYNASAIRWAHKRMLTSPLNRFAPAMTYDSKNDVIVLFGGITGGKEQNDTWIFNMTQSIWELIPRQNPVPPAGIYSMVYDSSTSYIVAFGGNGLIGKRNETWTYTVSNNTWTNRTAIMSPPSRSSSSMVYDSYAHEVVLFGGDGLAGPLSDTWVYDMSSWKWSLRHPSTSPGPRYGHAMAFDSNKKSTILFGGMGANKFADTWGYDAINNTWAEIKTTKSPAPRQYHGIFYDSLNNMTVLFGGITDLDMGDTWLFGMKDGYSNGTYISQPKDTGGSAYYGEFIWNANIVQDTSIEFQIRTGMTRPELEQAIFIGPDGTAATYYIINGTKIASVHNGTRWIQYRANLASNSMIRTPFLYSVSIKYNIVQRLSVDSPSGSEKWSGSEYINWSVVDPDNDSLSFDIFLENGYASILLASNLSTVTRQWLWDTDNFPNGTYKIRIYAYDNNSEIPLVVSAVSSDIIVQHPAPQPPLYPPQVHLIAPPNNSYINSTIVDLCWIGNDPDNRDLVYTIYFSDQKEDIGRIPRNITTESHNKVANLANNTTYFWSVKAWNGKLNSSDSLTEIWSFSILLPPANIPPRINSTPPLEVQVGMKLVYKITAIDEDGDILNYSLIQGPHNLLLNSTSGEMVWIPETTDIGNHTIKVKVSDGRGGFNEQEFTLRVRDSIINPFNEKPQCFIIFPVNGSKLKGQIQIRGKAINGTLPLSSVQVRIDDGNWQTATGLDNWTLSLETNKLTIGKHIIEARASDGSFFSDTTFVEFSTYRANANVIIETTPWYLLIIIIIIVAVGLGIFIIKRR